MKNNYTFLELFGDIDEKFIYEASRPWKKQVIIKYRLLKTAVAGFILLFLAAGTMTHQEEVKAAWKQFTSWIGTALGLSEDVSSYTDVIGKTITRKGISVTIHEVAADKNDLWVAFSVTSDSEKTEEPVLLTDVLINKQEIQLSESYPVLLENGEMQGEVSHYTIEDNIFANEEADILIGTQMIVKGHDFPGVTLVGILAADLSLNTPDYRSAERTFQLLTQAAGRAGRDAEAGDVVIQTYAPDHYSIQAAAKQDYAMFFEQEMAFRRMLQYPPVCGILTIQAAGRQEETVGQAISQLKYWAEAEDGTVSIIGPANAPIYKVNDIYRKILYLKSENYDILIKIRTRLEELWETAGFPNETSVQYDIT